MKAACAPENERVLVVTWRSLRAYSLPIMEIQLTNLIEQGMDTPWGLY